jgi:hypothetical protein
MCDGGADWQYSADLCTLQSCVTCVCNCADLDVNARDSISQPCAYMLK